MVLIVAGISVFSLVCAIYFHARATLIGMPTGLALPWRRDLARCFETTMRTPGRVQGILYFPKGDEMCLRLIRRKRGCRAVARIKPCPIPGFDLTLRTFWKSPWFSTPGEAVVEIEIEIIRLLSRWPNVAVYADNGRSGRAGRRPYRSDKDLRRIMRA